MEDTNEAATRAYRELLRQAGPAKRLEMCASLTRATREMAMAGLASQNPGATQVDLLRALAERAYGPDIAKRLRLAP